MIHFNWTQLFVGHHYTHVATLAITSLFLIVVGFLARRQLGVGAEAVAPSGSFSLKGVLEVFLDLIVNVSDMVIGKHGRHFIPLFTVLFLYLLVNNLFGLLPGMTPATENINTTVAIGVFSFFAYNYFGLKEHGLSYLKQFLGPLLLLAPLMIIIELVSHIVRPVSLGLRLQGNMVGDHTVLGIFLELLPVWLPVPVIFYVLGIFVCFMQAFVFTMLSMVYVSMAISHDH